MIKKFSFLFVLLFPVCHSPLFAQRTTLIGIETGVHVLAAKISNTENIRADVSPSPYENESNTRLRSNCFFGFAGFKIENFTVNHKFSFSSGLKYSKMSGQIRQKNFLLFPVNYFFYRFKEEGTTTEYLRIREINQDTDCLTLPLEVRYFPFKPRKFKIYLKSGIDTNITLASDTHVVFVDPQMGIFENEVEKDLDKPKSINAIGHIATGIRFGNPSKCVFGLELASPSFHLNPGAAGIIKPTAGMGILFHAELPLNKKFHE